MFEVCDVWTEQKITGTGAPAGIFGRGSPPNPGHGLDRPAY